MENRHAIAAAQAFIRSEIEPEAGPVVIQHEHTIATDDCLIFFYQSVRFIAGEESAALCGNVPLSFDRATGHVSYADEDTLRRLGAI